MRVLRTLRAFWGDDLPPSTNPCLTALFDAVALDDWDGRRRGVVVQGDGLTLQAVAMLLSQAPTKDPAEVLPQPLVDALERRGLLASVRPVSVVDVSALEEEEERVANGASGV